jgi:hypothetical protein
VWKTKNNQPCSWRCKHPRKITHNYNNNYTTMTTGVS